MRKIATYAIAFILSAALLAGALAACGDRNTSQLGLAGTLAAGDILILAGIPWLVLDVQDGKALVISEHVLEFRKINQENREMTWDRCDIRQYLNGEFIEVTFSDEEKGRIIETGVPNNANPDLGTNSGEDTIDRVFFLSIDEARLYLPDNESRKAQFDDGVPAWWWLRSAGGKITHFARVRSGGLIDLGGNYVNVVGGVRPAMWVSI